MFGSRNSVGVDEHPRERAEQRRQTPAEREHPPHSDADETARVGVRRRRAQAEAELREAEEQPEQGDRADRDADRAEVLDRDDHAAHVDRAGRDALGKLFGSPPQIQKPAPFSATSSPIVTMITVSAGPRSKAAAGSAQRDADADAIASVAKNAPQYGNPWSISVPGDEGREHRHLPLGEIDDLVAR